MDNQNIKASPTINGFTTYENWDTALLIKLLWKDGLLQTTTIKKKHSAVMGHYENEKKQMEDVLKNLFIKEPKNVTFTKRQLYYFSQNLQLFKPALKVLYTFSEGKNIGRVYPVGSLGFTTTRKEIRHTFCKNKWIDIDISNAHPNLLNQMYQGRYNILNDYCKNRSSYFEKLKQHFTAENGEQFLEDDDICKSYFITCVLYNGGWEGYLKTNGLPSGVPVPDFHNELMAEMSSIYQDLLTKHSELAADLFKKKDWNEQGCLISWICQDKERLCLEAMVDFATIQKIIPKTKKDKQVVLAYDGFQLPINPKINPVFLRKMETFILEQTGYDLKLTTKPFDKGFTAEELDFEMEEPPPLENDSGFDVVEILGEYLNLPDDEQEQIVVCKEVFDKFMECLFSRTEVDIARAIKGLCQEKIAFVGGKIWYFFHNNCWNKDEDDMTRSIISDRAYSVFQKILEACQELDGDEEMIEHNKKRMRAISELQIDLKKTNQKNNIYREMKECCLDVEFAKDFNIAKDVLPLKNGMLINLVDNTRRQRTILDKFDYECPVEFVENYKNGEDYIKSIFPNDMVTLQVFCDVIKTCMSGRQMRKVFICSGSGRNGKSLLFKKMSFIFNKGMDTLSKSLFVETKSSSSLNTDFEKLDKIRIGFNGEIEDDDKLNQSTIKKISGGDSINLRTLHTKDYTIFPTANLFLNVNSLPNFSKEQALIDRLVNFPFNAVFPEDISYEEKVDGWLDEIFTYIMITGKLIDVIELSPAMVIQKQEHIEEQADCLVDFIKDRIDVLEPSDLPYSKRGITNRDFYDTFIMWCHQHHYQGHPSINLIAKKMKILKFDKKESCGKTYWLDIKWKIENDLDEE